VVTDVRARRLEPVDHAAFRGLLAAGWANSNGYHSGVTERWLQDWPQVLDEFQHVLVVEHAGQVVGYAALQSHDIAYTKGLKRALCDHFLAPGIPSEEAIALLVPSAAAFARSQGYARLTLNMEPQEQSNLEALRGLGAFPERVAMYTAQLPDWPIDPAVRPARPDEWDLLTEMGGRIAEHLSTYPGALPSPAFPELVRLTADAYRDYGSTRPHTFFVYQKDGQVAGFVFAVRELPDGGLIYDLYTEPRFRRQGISRALYRSASRWLRDQGAAWLTLSVFATNRPAITAYEQWGFFPYFVAWEVNL